MSKDYLLGNKKNKKTKDNYKIFFKEISEPHHLSLLSATHLEKATWKDYFCKKSNERNPTLTFIKYSAKLNEQIYIKKTTFQCFTDFMKLHSTVLNIKNEREKKKVKRTNQFNSSP